MFSIFICICLCNLFNDILICVKLFLFIDIVYFMNVNKCKNLLIIYEYNINEYCKI